MKRELISLVVLLVICRGLGAQKDVLITNVNIISMKDSMIAYKKSVLIGMERSYRSTML